MHRLMKWENALTSHRGHGWSSPGPVHLFTRNWETIQLLAVAKGKLRSGTGYGRDIGAAQQFDMSQVLKVVVFLYQNKRIAITMQNSLKGKTFSLV